MACYACLRFLHFFFSQFLDWQLCFTGGPENGWLSLHVHLFILQQVIVFGVFCYLDLGCFFCNGYNIIMRCLQ